jgi:hypothetical protein
MGVARVVVIAAGLTAPMPALIRAAVGAAMGAARVVVIAATLTAPIHEPIPAGVCGAVRPKGPIPGASS